MTSRRIVSPPVISRWRLQGSGHGAEVLLLGLQQLKSALKL
jgi:hypothetical protein